MKGLFLIQEWRTGGWHPLEVATDLAFAIRRIRHWSPNASWINQRESDGTRRTYMDDNTIYKIEPIGLTPEF